MGVKIGVGRMDGGDTPRLGLDPLAFQRVSGTVARDMFGGNLLFDRDRVGETGTFSLAAEKLGLTGLRYPGGSITESMFDIRNPDATVAVERDTGVARPVMPLSEFLTFAQEQGLAPTIVLPTRPALADGAQGERLPEAAYLADLRGFVRDVLSGTYGAVDVRAFEIGNEYWGSGRMTATEYGRLADAYARLVQEEIDAHRAQHRDADWVEPRISVQMGQAGAWSTDAPGHVQNGQIIGALSAEARDAIDAVVGHYYSTVPYHELSSRDWVFDRLDVWATRWGLEDVAFHITEWNVSRHHPTEAGVQYAQHMVAQFAQMVARGADAAWAWPIQQNTGTEFSRDEGNPALTHMGQVYARLAARLPEAELVAVHYDNADLGVQKYLTASAEVLLVSARAEQAITVSIDPAMFGAGFDAGLTSVTATVMGYHGDPFARQPVSEFRILSGIDLSAGVVEFTLAPWEIAEIVLTYGANGVQLSGLLVETEVAGVAYGDRIVGTPHDDVLRGGSGDDLILGVGGNNRLYGERGNNEIHGGDRDDLIHGGTGNDRIFAGGGNNTIHGGGGRNEIHGGDGDDLIFAGRGGDTIHGGGGDDRIFGAAGADRIEAGPGHDVVYGGRGADEFVFRPGDETVWIMDFSLAEGDRLLLDPGLWEAPPDAAALVAEHARVAGRHVVLDFGAGDAITLHGFSDLDGLAQAISYL
jgi:Ca2+-binding RTX toxin-like protein